MNMYSPYLSDFECSYFVFVSKDQRLFFPTQEGEKNEMMSFIAIISGEWGISQWRVQRNAD